MQLFPQLKERKIYVRIKKLIHHPQGELTKFKNLLSPSSHFRSVRHNKVELSSLGLPGHQVDRTGKINMQYSRRSGVMPTAFHVIGLTCPQCDYKEIFMIRSIPP